MKLCECCLDSYNDDYLQNKYGYDIICRKCFEKISQKYSINGMRLLMEQGFNESKSKDLLVLFRRKYKDLNLIYEYDCSIRRRFCPYSCILLLEFILNENPLRVKKSEQRLKNRLEELKILCNDKNNFYV